jgi:rhodanese-related sulfurtransferase
MPQLTCEATIDVHELSRSTDPALRCIDVRSPTEFAAGHIPAAINIPMDEIEGRLADLCPQDHLILVCQSGKRASMTRALLANRSFNLTVLTGGTSAWQQAGLPLVASTRSRWSLERQVRLGAGLLVLTGVVLGFLVHRDWFYLAAFVGAGLVFAGTTNFCAMASLLALLPRNRRGSSKLCSSGKVCGCSTK